MDVESAFAPAMISHVVQHQPEFRMREDRVEQDTFSGAFNHVTSMTEAAAVSVYQQLLGMKLNENGNTSFVTSTVALRPLRFLLKCIRYLLNDKQDDRTQEEQGTKPVGMHNVNRDKPEKVSVTHNENPSTGCVVTEINRTPKKKWRREKRTTVEKDRIDPARLNWIIRHEGLSEADKSDVPFIHSIGATMDQLSNGEIFHVPSVLQVYDRGSADEW